MRFGFIIGLGAGALSGALVALAYSLRRSLGPAVWDSRFSLQVARSAYPVVPMARAQMSLLSFDYVFVSRFLGPAALATYGLGYTTAQRANCSPPSWPPTRSLRSARSSTSSEAPWSPRFARPQSSRSSAPS